MPYGQAAADGGVRRNVVQGYANFQTMLCERVPLAGIVHPQQARDPAASEGRSDATVEILVMHGWHRDAHHDAYALVDARANAPRGL